jgi:hypothetical protein
MSQIDPQDAARARRKRNLAMGLGLAGFVILIFVVTIARLSGNVAQPHF